MKLLLACAASLCLLLPAAVSAQGTNSPMKKAEHGQSTGGERHTVRAPESPVRPAYHHRAATTSVHMGERSSRHATGAWVKPRSSQWYWRGRWVARVRAPAFHYPRGYHYRHWAIGMRLPALFLAGVYFYDDIGPLGLEAPPPGYRWVRYGPDLLLVNLRTGDVEQVAYGVFY